MKRQVILDTGPLVAFINGRDQFHECTRLQWAHINPPLLTCQGVLSEACFLLSGIKKGQAIVLELLKQGVLGIPFRIEEHINQIIWLLQKYADVPMSMTDACLMRMSELYAESSVLNLDNDAKIYRKNKRMVIPILSPPNL